MRRNLSRSGIVRKQRRQRFAIKHWSDRLPDVPAFVVGNGPSLSNTDISILADYFTIGLNRAFYLLDPTILLWQDISLWNTEYHRVHNLKALKVARDTADPRRIYYNFYLKGGGYKFDPDKKTHILYGRGSSGPIGVQLAVALGCRPIILLGMDCKRGPKGESDFYGENPHWLPHTLDHCQNGLEWLQKNCPVEIINCGDNDFWPKEDLNKVVQNINKVHACGRQAYVKQLLALS
jgi:hypothetical protein